MLIRLAGHFINNPNHIDKLISIKGLPEEWMFRKTVNGIELAPPWQPDIEANIPLHIRHLCEPRDVTFSFPPIEKGRQGVVETRKVIGLKLDFMTGPGSEMWEKVERYLDKMTPRDQKVPEPVLVAPNQKSEFSPHYGRRTVRGSLELVPADIPEVDLRENLTPPPAPPEEPHSVVTTTLVDDKPFMCGECGAGFKSKGMFVIHKNKHTAKNKQKVGV